MTAKRTKAVKNEETTSEAKATFDVDTDKDGNITAIYSEDGKKVAEYEWQRVDDPSPAVRCTTTKPYSIAVDFGD